jgi:N6-adenosine-specific RNA methylase IME4
MTTATTTDLNILLDAGHTYGTIYADPPWRYDNTAARGGAAKHYDGTMTVDGICALPVDRLAAPDAHLYLWVTNAFLFDGLNRVMPAWGFDFVGTFNWLKPTMGAGNYFRNAHETLLIGTRPGTHPPADEMPGYMLINRGRHSAKPEQVRSMIETYAPGPYLELFGRSPANGWTVFGNQIDRGLLFHGGMDMARSAQAALLG